MVTNTYVHKKTKNKVQIIKVEAPDGDHSNDEIDVSILDLETLEEHTISWAMLEEYFDPIPE